MLPDRQVLIEGVNQSLTATLIIFDGEVCQQAIFVSVSEVTCLQSEALHNVQMRENSLTGRTFLAFV